MELKCFVSEAVCEGVSQAAADRIVGLKKGEMAEAAEALIAATGWLPALLQTAVADQKAAESETSVVTAA